MDGLDGLEAVETSAFGSLGHVLKDEVSHFRVLDVFGDGSYVCRVEVDPDVLEFVGESYRIGYHNG